MGERSARPSSYPATLRNMAIQSVKSNQSSLVAFVQSGGRAARCPSRFISPVVRQNKPRYIAPKKVKMENASCAGLVMHFKLVQFNNAHAHVHTEARTRARTHVHASHPHAPTRTHTRATCVNTIRTTHAHMHMHKRQPTFMVHRSTFNCGGSEFDPRTNSPATVVFAPITDQRSLSTDTQPERAQSRACPGLQRSRIDKSRSVFGG
jgi:hypothetical protein